MKHIKFYIFTLIINQGKATIKSLSSYLENVSHDSLTDFLNKDWQGQILLSQLLKPFNWLSGYLIIDDTTIDKRYGKHYQGARYVFDTGKEKIIMGYQVVLLIWTNGIIRIPLGMRLYSKNSKSKID